MWATGTEGRWDPSIRAGMKFQPAMGEDWVGRNYTAQEVVLWEGCPGERANGGCRRGCPAASAPSWLSPGSSAHKEWKEGGRKLPVLWLFPRTPRLRQPDQPHLVLGPVPICPRVLCSLVVRHVTCAWSSHLTPPPGGQGLSEA